MMKRAFRRAFLCTALVLAALAMVLLVVAGCQPPAPLVVRPQAVASSPRWVTVNTASITQSSAFIGGVDWGSEGYAQADAYYSIDQGTVNTVTLTLQVSPNDSVWIAHNLSSTIVADNAEDATNYMGGIAVHLQYFRITATLSNNNAITPTIRVYLH